LNHINNTLAQQFAQEGIDLLSPQFTYASDRCQKNGSS